MNKGRGGPIAHNGHAAVREPTYNNDGVAELGHHSSSPLPSPCYLVGGIANDICFN